jgi:small-conductance mechanosensitive channel
MPSVAIDYVSIGLKLLASLVAATATYVVYHIVRDILRRRISDKAHFYTLRMLVRNAFFFTGGVVVLIIWLGLGSNFTVAMGILGAGIAFASQEVIGSFAGYLNIVTSSIYRIGDRVRIGDVVGDVMDITIMRTTVMEIGEWVRADQYTGRIVTVANRAVFAGPVYNYTQHWGYIWDEITLPFTYDSDWRLAGEIMLAHGQEYTADLHQDATQKLQDMMARYPLQQTQVEPTLYLSMTDNWIEMSLRYVVRARERRNVKAQLHRELLQHFEGEETIQVASATFEIVGLPALQGELKLGKQEK